jgi:hypothetical protein
MAGRDDVSGNNYVNEKLGGLLLQPLVLMEMMMCCLSGLWQCYLSDL